MVQCSADVHRSNSFFCHYVKNPSAEIGDEERKWICMDFSFSLQRVQTPKRFKLQREKEKSQSHRSEDCSS